jgi:POT family proton-dependent oligopeptide transporter
MMAFPSQSVYWLFAALVVVVFGNGFFKANISVLVGNLYSHKDKSLKDAGYNIFYMGINIGAFFAPFAASGIKNFFLNTVGTDLATAYNAGFGVAAGGMLISMLIFLIFRKYYSDADYQSGKNANADKDEVMSKTEEKNRIWALIIVYVIVVFFWMAFHQNGAALAYFARDYVVKFASQINYVLFDLAGLLAFLATIFSLIMLLRPKTSAKNKGIMGVVAVVSAIVLFWRYSSFEAQNMLDPEKFQAFNPMFIVFMTPLIVGFWAWLHKKGKEPSTPKKIGIGMMIIAFAFVIMIFASLGLPGVYSLGEEGSDVLVSPYWLISTYLFLTLGELCISPMGLSLVSKVSPPRFRGIMMGFWFGATALGNYLVGFVGRFYQNWELWQFFLMLVITSIIASILVMLFSKKLEKVTEA